LAGASAGKKYMKDNWRYTARSVTKYNPIYRDENGKYLREEWLGFFQIGKKIGDQVLTFEIYSETESKYIESAILFFKFHNCDKVVIKNVEKNGFGNFQESDKDELLNYYDQIYEGMVLNPEQLNYILKLVLREFLWGEFFCVDSNEIALRFGYDFYMHFNSNKDMGELFKKIKKIGLFVN
jgi:hypothetical protein